VQRRMSAKGQKTWLPLSQEF